MRGQKLAIIVFSCLGATLLGLIIWAARAENLWQTLLAMLRTRWGVVTLVDLLIGLLIFGTWIAALERRWWPTIGWMIGLACLGNLVTVVYFLLRPRATDSLAEAFSPKTGVAHHRTL